MRILAAVARGFAMSTLGAAFQVFVALEALYLWWLPRERPVRPTRALPSFVRAALWADLGGKGRPRLDPQIPFLLPMIASALGPEPSDKHSALLLVSRYPLPRMGQLEYQARWVALATWVSRHWTIEEVLDAVGEQAWMGPAGSGFERAASHYWGRSLDALEPHEVATLLAVMVSAGAYDPACKPQRALSGRAIALERMRAAGVIDEVAFHRAMVAPVRVLPPCDKPPAEPHQAVR